LEDELAERANPLPQERRERLETAHRNSLRLLKLVNTLLDFSRIEAGRVQATTNRQTSPHTQRSWQASFVRDREAGLTLAIDCPALPEPVYVDREMWEKIVLEPTLQRLQAHLRGEHRRHASVVRRPRQASSGRLRRGHSRGSAAASVASGSIVLRERKSRTHEGTGIGLALVQELVGLHGGNLSVASEEEREAHLRLRSKQGRPTFRLTASAQSVVLSWTATRSAAYVEEALHWLPTRRRALRGRLRIGEFRWRTFAAGYVAARWREGSRILWADDNADMRDYVCRLLAGRYDVLPVPDGLKALAAAEADPPDLVLNRRHDCLAWTALASCANSGRALVRRPSRLSFVRAGRRRISR